jgi:hypothetical protein
LEDLDAEVEINSVWEMIGENIKIQPKRGSISHDTTKDAQNYYTIGKKLNFSGYRFKAK